MQYIKLLLKYYSVENKFQEYEKEASMVPRFLMKSNTWFMVFHVEQVKYLSFLYRLISNMMLRMPMWALGHHDLFQVLYQLLVIWFSFGLVSGDETKWNEKNGRKKKKRFQKKKIEIKQN